MVHIEKPNVMPEFLILTRIKDLFVCMIGDTAEIRVKIGNSLTFTPRYNILN